MKTKNVPELGRIPAYVSRYWRPAIANVECQYCKRKFYHILAHFDDCPELKKRTAETDDERKS